MSGYIKPKKGWHDMNTDRIYSLVEKGIEYKYDRETAARLAIWAKERKSLGQGMAFKDFYDTLSYYEQGAVRVDKPDEFGRTFKNPLTWK